MTTRRFFLKSSGLAMVAFGVAPRALVRSAYAANGRKRTLVVVFQRGACDGLNTVVPYADDAYRAARPAIAIPAAEVLRIDDYRGLHPALARLRAQYDAGKLAIVEGVGYPDPIRSHFKSFDVWHAADPAGRSVPEGWLGRLARAACEGSTDPNLCVHVGGRVPYSLQSATHPPVSFATPTGYRWAGTDSERAAFEQSAELDTQIVELFGRDFLAVPLTPEGRITLLGFLERERSALGAADGHLFDGGQAVEAEMLLRRLAHLTLSLPEAQLD